MVTAFHLGGARKNWNGLIAPRAVTTILFWVRFLARFEIRIHGESEFSNFTQIQWGDVFLTCEIKGYRSLIDFSRSHYQKIIYSSKTTILGGFSPVTAFVLQWPTKFDQWPVVKADLKIIWKFELDWTNRKKVNWSWYKPYLCHNR